MKSRLKYHRGSAIIRIRMVAGRTMNKIFSFLSNIKWIIWGAGVVWAAFVFIYTIQGLPSRVEKLETKQAELISEHYEIYNRLSNTEHKFDVSVAEINTQLKQISTDIIFIRERLFK